MTTATLSNQNYIVKELKEDPNYSNFVDEKIGKYRFIMFHNEKNDFNHLIIFKGSSSKQFACRTFNDTANQASTVAYYEKMATEELEARQKAQSMKASDKVAIGDILYDSWGYSMTIVDFYQVVGFKGQKTIVVKGLDTMTVSGDAGWSGTKSAVKDAFTSANEYSLRLDKYGYFRGTLQGREGSSAAIWDGKPKYFNSLD